MPSERGKSSQSWFHVLPLGCHAGSQERERIPGRSREGGSDSHGTRIAIGGMTIMPGGQGVVFQLDLGEGTAEGAKAVSAYDPDGSPPCRPRR
jgi:hypothetical protein